MAAPMKNTFELPPPFDTDSVPGAESKICIISVFGKGRLNPFSSNATPLNSVIDKDVFQVYNGYLQEQIEKGHVECYFDSDHKIMYLHLTSFYNINNLSQCCERLCRNDEMQDFYSCWQEEDLRHAKHLLILFTFSHLILLCHPGSNFDMSYLRLFHTLEAIRLKINHQMCDILSTVPGVSKDWAHCGRLCTPRMLYLFETPAVDVQPEESDGGVPKSSKKYPPMKKLQMSLENMIFRILRKTRAITNISNNSLFSVPINQPYVYIQGRRNDVWDPVDFVLAQIKNKCCHAKEESSQCAGFASSHSGQPSAAKAKPYSASRRMRVNAAVPEPLPSLIPSLRSSPLRNMAHQLNCGKGQGQAPFFLSSTACSSSSSSSSSPFSGLQRNQEQSLKEFLWQHIEMVFMETINDNIGRHGVEPFFVVPDLGTWLKAVGIMHTFLMSSEAEGDHQGGPACPQFVHGLTSTLDISMRFSENRCQKVMASAENAYQQDLPEFYINSFHKNRLSKAKNVFSQFARGPAFDKYLHRLEQWCDAYWKAGHQRCEAISLTGNLCTMPIHCLPSEERSSSEDVPTAEHTSGLKTKSTCNCGRTQADKDDPFHHRYANHEFYQMLEEACCGHLEHIQLPVFTPTTPEACPIETAVSPHSVPVHAGQQQQQQQQQQHQQHLPDSHEGDAFATQSELSLALSLGQTNTTPVELPIRLSQTQDDKSLPCISELDQKLERKTSSTVKPHDADCLEKDKSPLPRQISTTEYLCSMIHSNSPPGLLPRFSSFSLCRLGPAGLYSHLMGLDLAGFLPGSSFLLPWDIAVKKEQERWPSVSETFGSGKKRQQRKLSKGACMESSESQTTVRVYLGMEYECPRGHRFFCSGPDKIIKVSANSTVKDNAGRLVHMDMPLYTLCHCKQPKGCMAQMMRVFIVTPKDSPNCPAVRVLARPIVQPNPHPCAQFHPGLDAPLELPPDGVWVLRLPHIYQDDHRVYLMPSDPQHLHSCYLTKGTFTPKIL